MLIEVENLQVSYGGAMALKDLSIRMAAGEAVCVIGANGAGKTTLLRTISGLVAPAQGRIRFDGLSIEKMPARKIARLGIAHVPEARRILPALTVLDNLRLGAYTRRDGL